MSRRLYYDEEAKQFFPEDDVPEKHGKTNADRIRAMTDEQLADAMYLSACVRSFDKSHGCEDNGCRKCWIDWLKQEATDEL